MSYDICSAFVCVRANDEFALLNCDIDYDFISGFVEGWVEFASLSSECGVYVNEMGKLNGLPVNRIATGIARFINPAFDDVIVGNAIFCGPADEEGNDTVLSDRLVLDIAGFYRMFSVPEGVFNGFDFSEGFE